MIGKRLSRYEITEKLGAGGMGVVYKATDTTLDRSVAIKLLPPHLHTDEEARKRFIKEARAASALEHPNIGGIFEIDTSPDDQLFLVMPCYEGRTLRERILAGPVEVDEALELMTQITSGLAKAHSKGIVHRDIKPANIFVTDDGHPKVLDFGLAKLVGETRLTRTGTTVGTVKYMSPEQARGDETGPTSDVFSLGVVFYELLTGALPFDAEHEQAVIYRIVTEDPAPLSAHRADLPDVLQTIVDKALVKDPSARYANAGELLADLKRCRSGESVTRTLSRPRPAGVRRLLYAIAVLLAVIGGYSVYDWAVSRRGTSSESVVSADRVAVFPFTVSGGNDDAYLGASMVDLIGRGLDGVGELTTVTAMTMMDAVGSGSQAEFGRSRAEEIARRLGAGAYVVGNIVHVGSRFNATATLRRLDDDYEVTVRSSVDSEDQVVELAEDLAGQLLRDLEGEIAALLDGFDAPLEALRAFVNGEKRLRQGQFRQAIRDFERAVAVDSALVPAWVSMSVAADYSIEGGDMHNEALEHAFEYRDRLPERDRMRLDAKRAYGRGEVSEAVRIAKALLSTDPNDSGAWMIIWAATFDRAALERGCELGAAKFDCYSQMYMHYGTAGKPDSALIMMEKLLEIAPESDNDAWFRTILAFGTGNADDEQTALKALSKSEPMHIILCAQNLLQWFDDPEGARQVMRLLTQPVHRRELRARGYIEMAAFDLAAGRLDEAASDLSSAEELDALAALEYRALFMAAPFFGTPESELRAIRSELGALTPADVPVIENANMWLTPDATVHPQIRLYLLGLLSSSLGELDAARAHADELDAMADGSSDAAVAKRLATALRAHMSLSTETPGESLRNFEEISLEGTFYVSLYMSPFYSCAREYYERARLLETAGRDSEALQMYRQTYDYATANVIYLAPSSLGEARIYERLGETDNAIERYRRVVDVLRDCDPELRSMLEEAQQRLDALTSS